MPGPQQGQLDILVNSVWGGYERMMENNRFTWPLPFWEQPLWRWDAMLDAGVRASLRGWLARRADDGQRRRGLIVNISFWAAQKHIANVPYGVSKAATDKMSADMAHELRPHDVDGRVALPGLVRTEKVMEAAVYLDLSNSESPSFTGRAVAALSLDPELMARSGSMVVAAACAREYRLHGRRWETAAALDALPGLDNPDRPSKVGSGLRAQPQAITRTRFAPQPFVRP